jgi:hypothetical protein
MENYGLIRIEAASRQARGSPGQYDSIDENPNKFYLPLAREACQIGLTYNRKEKITAIEPGPAFDATKWERSRQEIEKSILDGPLKVGRDYSFSGYRVSGSWQESVPGCKFFRRLMMRRGHP